MTQLLDRFASYRIMTKLHNSLRGPPLPSHPLPPPPGRPAQFRRDGGGNWGVVLRPPDWRICSPPYLEIHSEGDLACVHQAVTDHALSFPLS